MLSSIPATANNLTQTYLDIILLGLDDDSVSTLGTSLGSRIVAQMIGNTAGVPSKIFQQTTQNPTGDVSLSDQSLVTMETMDSQISQIGDTLNTMEVNISSSMEKSTKIMLRQFMQGSTDDQVTNSPPLGEIHLISSTLQHNNVCYSSCRGGRSSMS